MAPRSSPVMNQFRANGMAPRSHEAIKRQSAARGITQARFLESLLDLLGHAQILAETDGAILDVLESLGLERQGL